jgi:hypothetical protein
VVGEITGISGSTLVDVRFSRPRASFLVALALQRAVLQCEVPESDWTAVLITRPQSGRSKAESNGLRIAGSGADRRSNAQELVEFSARLSTWADHDAVPLFERSSRTLASGRLSGVDQSLESDLLDGHTALIWEGASLSSLLDEPLLDSDPGELLELARKHRIDSRAIAVATWVWGTFDRLVELVNPDGTPAKPTAASGGDSEDGDE